MLPQMTASQVTLPAVPLGSPDTVEILGFETVNSCGFGDLLTVVFMHYDMRTVTIPSEDLLRTIDIRSEMVPCQPLQFLGVGLTLLPLWMVAQLHPPCSLQLEGIATPAKLVLGPSNLKFDPGTNFDEISRIGWLITEGCHNDQIIVSLIHAPIHQLLSLKPSWSQACQKSGFKTVRASTTVPGFCKL